MTTDLSGRASRRAILTAAAGGAAALAVSGLAKPFPAAAAAVNMQTESTNATSLPTGVSNSTADSGALFGTADSGYGVRGVSTDISAPATHTDNVGLLGVAGDPTVLDGFPKGPAGVYGWSPASPDVNLFGTGVWGDSEEYGVFGSGAIGVDGWGDIGVLAEAKDPSSLALVVSGRAEFTRSGRSTISSGSAAKTVSLAGCTTSTLVFAVLASNRSGRYVRAVVPTTGSFKIYLNTSVTKSTYVVWIAFTNPSNNGG